MSLTLAELPSELHRVWLEHHPAPSGQLLVHLAAASESAQTAIAEADAFWVDEMRWRFMAIAGFEPSFVRVLNARLSREPNTVLHLGAGADGELCSALRAAVHLRALSISMGKLSHHSFTTVVSALSDLRSLELNQCMRIDDAVLSSIVTNLVHLTSLKIAHSAAVTNAGLGLVAQLPFLFELRIVSCSHITSAVLPALGSAPKLRLLGLQQLSSFLLRDPWVLARALPQLEELDVRLSCEATDELLVAVASAMPNIRALRCSNTKAFLTRKGLAAVGAMTFLRDLAIGKALPTAFAAGLHPLADLKILCIDDGKLIDDDAVGQLVAAVTGNSRLEVLHLAGCPSVTDAGLAELSKSPVLCASLCELALSQFDGISRVGVGEMLRAALWRSLRRLIIKDCKHITPAVVGELNTEERARRRTATPQSLSPDGPEVMLSSNLRDSLIRR